MLTIKNVDGTIPISVDQKKLEILTLKRHGNTFAIAKAKYEIKEIPIIFTDRVKGYSKIPKLEILRTLKNLFILSMKNLMTKL